MSAIRAEHPSAEVQVWATDEARLGLQPVTRCQWAPVGQRPRSCGRPEYEWEYVYGFVEPTSGATWFYLWSGVDTQLFELTLREFAAAFGLGPERQVVLLLDGAGWHSALAARPARLPVGVHLVIQPPCSPELQPAERLWPLTREALANRVFNSLGELEPVLIERCRQLNEQPGYIAALTGYHWWHEAVREALAA